MKICDRCDNKLQHHLAQTRFPTYNIIGIWDTNWKTTIDLCPRCESDFTEWLKELKDENQESEELNE